MTTTTHPLRKPHLGRIVFVCFLSALGSACRYKPGYQDEQTRCSTARTCPKGYRCSPDDAGLCLREPGADRNPDAAARGDTNSPPLDVGTDVPVTDVRPRDGAPADASRPTDAGAADAPADAHPSVDACPTPDPECPTDGGVACLSGGNQMIRCRRNAAGCLEPAVISSCGLYPCEGPPGAARCRCSRSAECDGRDAGEHCALDRTTVIDCVTDVWGCTTLMNEAPCRPGSSCHLVVGKPTCQ